MSDAGSCGDPSTWSIESIVRALEADFVRGLTHAEATRRLARDGPNELLAKAAVPAWRRLLAQVQDPLIYLLLAAIAIALLVWFIEGRIGWPVDAVVIAAIVVLDALLGFAQQAKAQNAVAATCLFSIADSARCRCVRTNGFHAWR